MSGSRSAVSHKIAGGSHLAEELTQPLLDTCAFAKTMFMTASGLRVHDDVYVGTTNSVLYVSMLLYLFVRSIVCYCMRMRYGL